MRATRLAQTLVDLAVTLSSISLTIALLDSSERARLERRDLSRPCGWGARWRGGVDGGEARSHARMAAASKQTVCVTVLVTDVCCQDPSATRWGDLKMALVYGGILRGRCSRLSLLVISTCLASRVNRMCILQLSDDKGLVIQGGAECVILLLLVEALTGAGEASIIDREARSSRSPDVHVHVTLYFSALVVHDRYRDSKKHCAQLQQHTLKPEAPERSQGAGHFSPVSL